MPALARRRRLRCASAHGLGWVGARRRAAGRQPRAEDDQREEQQQPRGGAEHAERCQRQHHLEARQPRRGEGQRERGQQQAGAGSRDRDHPQQRHVGEGTLHQQRRARVAERRQQHHDGPDEPRLVGADVDPEQDGDPADAKQQPQQPQPTDPLGGVEPQREQRHEQRHRGDQQPGQGGGDALLAHADQQERDGDLQQCQRGELGQATAQPPQRPAPRGDRPEQQPRQVLERFAAGGSRLVLLWWGFAMSAVLLAPAVVVLSATLADADPTVLALATATGLLAALVQFLGLVRWPFAVPHLARVATDPAASPATIDAVEVVFQTLNRYLGVAVGEHLGYLFTGLWTALAGVALVQSEVLHPLVGVVGLVLAPLFVLGSLEFVGPFEPRGWRLAGTLVPLAYIGWSVWLLALGIGLLVTA